MHMYIQPCMCTHTHHEGGRRWGQKRNSQNIKVLIEKGVWLHVEHHGKSLAQLSREHELGYTSGYTIMTGKRSKRRQEGNLIGYHSVLCERWQRNRLEHHQKKSGWGCHDNAPLIGSVATTDIYFFAVLSWKSKIRVPVWSASNKLFSWLASGWIPFHNALTWKRKKEISSSKDHHGALPL